MPITASSLQERLRQSQVIADLQRKANYDFGPHQVYEENPFFVFNPTPDEYVTVWSHPDRVVRRKNAGYRVVDVERGKDHYLLPESDLDRSRNICRRVDVILMEATPAVHERAKAVPVLIAVNTLDKDIKAFTKAVGDSAREVDHQGGVVKRRKVGHLSEDERNELRARKIMNQIRMDQARLVQPVTPSMEGKAPYMPPGNDREDVELAVRQYIDHGNFKEITLTDNPESDLEDFE